VKPSNSDKQNHTTSKVILFYHFGCISSEE